MAKEGQGATQRSVLEERGGREVMAGQKGRVWLDQACLKEYDKLFAGAVTLNVKQQTQLGRYFEHFCILGQEVLTEEQFKREGAFADGEGTKIPIHVFKPEKWRLYGVVLEIDGVLTFVGLEVDPSKKQNKADQELLKRVGKTAGSLRAALQERKDGSAGEAKQGSNRGRRGSRH